MDWIQHLEVVEAREHEAAAEVEGVPLLHNYIGAWTEEDGVTTSLGNHWSWGDIWEFNTRFQYLRNLANVPDEDGNCLVGLGSKKLGRCLELGCDWGHRWCALEPFFDEVYGIEAVKGSAAIGVLRDREITHGLMENMPYDDDFFDVVISAHVLEHGMSPEVTLKEIYRVTKPHGWSVHTIPCKLSATVEAESITHKSTLSYQQWRMAFTKVGFNIIRDFFSWNFNQEDWTVIAKK